MNASVEATECTCIDKFDFSGISSVNVCDTNHTNFPHCLPVNYGISCAAHDALYNPLCLSAEPDNIPAFCFEQWCYVDFDSCFTSIELFQRSAYFKELGLYFSYTLCNSTSEPWDRQVVITGVQSKELLAAVPVDFYPYTFKRDPLGNVITDEEAYWNNDISWDGIIIDYLEAVFEDEGFSTINYTHRSLGSSLINPVSPYMATIHDVSSSIVDFGAADFWMTADRLKMTPFSVPFLSDKFFLWISLSKSPDSGIDLMRLAKPYTPGTWVLLVVIVIVTSLVALWLLSKNKNVFEKYNECFRSDSYRNSNFPGKLKIVYLAYQDFAMMNATSFFSGSVDFHPTATFPFKLLMIGFSFMVMISYSAYVANLAAFLTTEAQNIPIRSMHEATYKRLRICAPLTLEHDLKESWPEALFVFNDDESQSEIKGMIDYHDDGKCEGLVASIRDVQLQPEYYEEFCSRNLVSTGVVVKDEILSFPATIEVAPGLSYLIARASTRGIKFEDFLKKYEYNLCSLEVQVEDDDMAQINTADMLFPIIVFCSCLFSAIIWQIINDWMKKRKRVPSRKVRKARTLVSDFTKSEMNSVVRPLPRLFCHSVKENDTFLEGNENENNVCEVMETKEMTNSDIFTINYTKPQSIEKPNSETSEDVIDVEELIQMANRLKQIAESAPEKKDL